VFIEKHACRFTCFTSTKVRILTQKALQAVVVEENRSSSSSAQFTCLPGTKVRILTQKALVGGGGGGKALVH
jgi:hypothetical protein